jgi:hypothetical protein
MQTLIIALLFVSFIADQLMQSEETMHDKNKSVVALGMHVFCYSLTLVPFMFIVTIMVGTLDVAWTPILMIPVHFLIEFILQSMASRLYEKSMKRSYIFATMLEHLLVNCSLIYIFCHLLEH